MPAYVLIVHAPEDDAARRDLQYALAYLIEPKPKDAEIDKDHFYVEPPLAVYTAHPEKASVFLLLLGPAWEASEQAQALTRRALELRREAQAEVVGIRLGAWCSDILPADVRILPRSPDGQGAPLERTPASWLAVARELEPLLREHSASIFFRSKAAAFAHVPEPPRRSSPGQMEPPNPAPVEPAAPPRRANLIVPPPLEPVAPRVLGRFRAGKLHHHEIGTDVLEATDARGRRYWLKRRNRSSAVDEVASRERFLREADVLSRMTSLHVQRVYDFGDDPEHGPVIVMEALDGETLLERVKREGPLSLKSAHPIFEQALVALSHIHAAGALHLHLAMSKIRLTKAHDGATLVKVMDFSGCYRPGHDEKATIVTSEPGVFHYVAPEGVGRVSSVGPSADVYSIATCLFAALTGRTPFEGSSPLRVVEAKSTAEAPSLSQVRGEAVSPALELFVARALARKADHRFPTAQEALTAWRMLG